MKFPRVLKDGAPIMHGGWGVKVRFAFSLAWESWEEYGYSLMHQGRLNGGLRAEEVEYLERVKRRRTSMCVGVCWSV